MTSLGSAQNSYIVNSEHIFHIFWFVFIKFEDVFIGLLEILLTVLGETSISKVNLKNTTHYLL